MVVTVNSFPPPPPSGEGPVDGAAGGRPAAAHRPDPQGDGADAGPRRRRALKGRPPHPNGAAPAGAGGRAEPVPREQHHPAGEGGGGRQPGEVPGGAGGRGQLAAPHGGLCEAQPRQGHGAEHQVLLLRGEQPPGWPRQSCPGHRGWPDQ